jgi:hypothetical protein
MGIRFRSPIGFQSPVETQPPVKLQKPVKLQSPVALRPMVSIESPEGLKSFNGRSALIGAVAVTIAGIAIHLSGSHSESPLLRDTHTAALSISEKQKPDTSGFHFRPVTEGNIDSTLAQGAETAGQATTQALAELACLDLTQDGTATLPPKDIIDALHDAENNGTPAAASLSYINAEAACRAALHTIAETHGTVLMATGLQAAPATQSPKA